MMMREKAPVTAASPLTMMFGSQQERSFVTLARVSLLVLFFTVVQTTVLAMADVAFEEEASPEDLCTAYCQEYHSPLACESFDITSNAGSSKDALRGELPIDIPACVVGCLESGMRFDGTRQDFQNADTIQCRRNHIRMQVQEKALANSDHCLHAMFLGRERCNPNDAGTIWFSSLHEMGESLFWNPNNPITFFNQLLPYGLAAVYEGAMRGRLQVEYPYVEIPSDGVVCRSPQDTRFRSVDGSCNSVDMPRMGATGTQFVQVLKPSEAHPDGLPDVEAVAEILKRPEAIGPERLAPFNQLCVNWIQMMTHDWFQHGDTNTTGNQVSHWWDGSQLYGSTAEQAASVRTAGGKLHLDENGEVDYDENAIPRTGFGSNWWAGLHVMHTVFVREHNYIVDQLEREYPGQYSAEEKYQLARLSVSALMAKIHTLEWTPTLLDNPVSSVGLNANWRGAEEAILDYGSRLELEAAYLVVGRYYVPHAGSRTETTVQTLYNTTFQMTEEFVSVYRMHPLLPDELMVGSENFTLNELSFKDARKLVESNTSQTLLQAFGEAPSHTLALRNYPRELYNLQKPGMPEPINLAAIDLLRDRERELPRYNDMRRQLLLEPLASIDDLTSDPEERLLLKSVYSDIEQVDLMVGSLVDQDRPAGACVFSLSRRLEFPVSVFSDCFFFPLSTTRLCFWYSSVPYFPCHGKQENLVRSLSHGRFQPRRLHRLGLQLCSR